MTQLELGIHINNRPFPDGTIHLQVHGTATGMTAYLKILPPGILTRTTSGTAHIMGTLIFRPMGTIITHHSFDNHWEDQFRCKTVGRDVR